MRATDPRRPAIERPAPQFWSRIDWLGLLVVTVGAAVIRLPGLGRPVELVFDEIFYARDACWYVKASEAVCEINDLASRAHPPLGKWLIGAGIALFDYDPFGWRVGAAVAGTLTVALVYVLGRRLLAAEMGPGHAALGAAAGAALLGTDFLHIVHSRVAMLDVFTVLFVVAAMLAIVLDRDRQRETEPSGIVGRLTLNRPWRLLAGACLGAAAATKWSGAYIGLALIGLTIAWELAATRRRAGDPAWAGWRRTLRTEALPTVLMLGVVPVAVYVASYTGRMPGVLLGLPWEAGTVWRGIWDHQVAMFEFHAGLSGHHPYESPPWSWALLKRPVAYYFAEEGGAYREILALGNPVLWWPGLAAMLGIGVAWVRRGASVWRPEPVILVAALAAYAPWLVLSGSRSQVFLWYLLPSVPFLCLALGLLAARVWRTTAGRVAIVGYGLLIVASLAFYVPLLTALPLEPDGWRLRILFSDCARPSARTLRLPDDEINRGPPPGGWCWI